MESVEKNLSSFLTSDWQQILSLTPLSSPSVPYVDKLTSSCASGRFKPPKPLPAHWKPPLSSTT